MTTDNGPRWGAAVTVGRVMKFCEDAFPSNKKEGQWSSMGATLWEGKLQLLLNQHCPGRNYCGPVQSGVLLRNPKWFFTLCDLHLVAAKRYLYQALRWIIFYSDKNKAAPAIRKIANGKFQLGKSKFNQARRLRVMAAARLIADQLHVSYSQRVVGLEHLRLAYPRFF